MKDLIQQAILDASDDKVSAFNSTMGQITSEYLKDAISKSVKEKEKDIINKYK